MRKQELDSWLKEGGDLPEDLTEDEENYLKENGWTCSRSFSSCGDLLNEFHYVNGLFHGAHKYFTDGYGQKVMLIKSYKHSKKHGIWENSSPSRKFKVVREYYNDKKHGTWKTYAYEGGELIAHKEYAYGILLKDYLEEDS
jgi:antitoxin component YwqK of YwqJK toxin-antitoxin module